MLIILVGSVLGYVYYLKEKKEQLDAIKRGFCPSCHQKSINITDQRSAGCCGPKIVTFECTNCGYENSFSIEGGSCGI
jgi:RNase P subunit RPR2